MGRVFGLWEFGAGASLLALSAAPAWADDQAGGASSGTPERGEIVVYGERQQVFAGLMAETELDENDIAAYGFDTVGELLEEIASQVDRTGEGPVVLINGKLSNGINDVSDLPAEALLRVQILPSAAAARLGQNSTRRVINVVIKPDLKQVTANTRATQSTRGDAFQGEAEVNLLSLVNTNRRSLVLRAQRIDPLLESDRGIITDTNGVPFDRLGNVIAFAGVGSEIDPALSQLAGRLVTTAGVPLGKAQPSLADFAGRANDPNRSGAGDFRTLVSKTESLSANATVSERLGPNTTASVTARVERLSNSALTGLATSSFRVPAGSRFSPFTRDVIIADLVGKGLAQDQRATSISIGENLNTRIGKVSVSALANFSHRVSHTDSDRATDVSAVQSAIIAGTVNPFRPDSFASLLVGRTDRSRSRSDNGNVQVLGSGPLLTLPAGEVRLTTRAGARFDRFASSSMGNGFRTATEFRREEYNLQSNLSVPLFSSGTVGEVVADVTGELKHIDSAGTLYNYGAGLNWRVGPVLNVRASYSVDKTPPPSSSLTDPIVITDNLRVFDFIRQETVFVRYVTGGNPDLPTAKQRSTTIEATLRPFGETDLTLSAQYLRVRNDNLFAALPPASAEVQAAFPDRYLRDANGVLVQLDARPVTFLRDSTEQLRWGLNFNRTFGGDLAMREDDDDARGSQPKRGKGIRVNFSVNHNWTLDAYRQARAALAKIDLLRGGAIGYGGGIVRHLVYFDAGVATRGVGLQMSGVYRGRSVISTGTVAAPSRITLENRAIVNLRAFANLGPLLRDQSWAKGLRLTLQAANLFDSKQRAHDQNGLTPLRYQAFLLDPVGRTLSIGVRKVF